MVKGPNRIQFHNSPNDLQMMSDAPVYHLFCLLWPVDPNQKSLPEVLIVIHVSKNSVADGLSRGRRASGDLIPWTVAQQFQDHDFPMLSGARVVRIATHPDYQGMGYGSRALSLLKQYYELKIPSVEEDQMPQEHIESVTDQNVGLLEERIEPRKSLPPLLLKLSERPPEHLQYLEVSFGLTATLLKFWKRVEFVPVYLRQLFLAYACNTKLWIIPHQSWSYQHHNSWASSTEQFVDVFSI
ncbi:LOW QUALITY PROTEIN: RNA cytidine acetyltransferase-like [Zootermopsis nevadensis]|uniref:LOW QUALITY PROTEIN: RNA cytidine acetyltransferase-like n=1 Tax=Zootermopsis nevadensis TaxID=136037 RepID=UPI000B8E90B7|nr:LOW QUALITY PROTEIN: RNA cytidine acetyltransferase-like [Zootermopsis nevadensis]